MDVGALEHRLLLNTNVAAIIDTRLIKSQNLRDWMVHIGFYTRLPSAVTHTLRTEVSTPVRRRVGTGGRRMSRITDSDAVRTAAATNSTRTDAGAALPRWVQRNRSGIGFRAIWMRVRLIWCYVGWPGTDAADADELRAVAASL
jgi:hypothetical protein